MKTSPPSPPSCNTAGPCSGATRDEREGPWGRNGEGSPVSTFAFYRSWASQIRYVCVCVCVCMCVCLCVCVCVCVYACMCLAWRLYDHLKCMYSQEREAFHFVFVNNTGTLFPTVRTGNTCLCMYFHPSYSPPPSPHPPHTKALPTLPAPYGQLRGRGQQDHLPGSGCSHICPNVTQGDV